MKQSINEIGNTPQGMYTLGQVASRAYDRMLNGTKQSVGDGVVALNPKYGKVAQDAAHAAVGGYMDWRKRFKEQNGREPSDEEYRAWMQNYKNGRDDYGKPESEKRGIVKISESQLRKMIAESVKKVLKESDINNADFDMSPEAVSMRNRNRGIGDDGLNDAKREFRHILNWVAQSISAMSSVHYGNVNYQHTSFEREEERARQAVEAFHKLLDKVSIEYLD